MGYSHKSMKKDKAGHLPVPVHMPRMNQQKVVYHQSQIRNMQLFCEDVGQQQSKISDMPFQIDILEVYHDRIYVVSSEKSISVFDLITYEPVFGDKKLETSEHISALCFHEEKMFIG